MGIFISNPFRIPHATAFIRILVTDVYLSSLRKFYPALRVEFIMLMLKILVLATLLASGSLLIILAGALYSNWLPLLSLLAYSLAPLPNYIARRMTSDLVDHRGILETGHFFSSFLLVSAVGSYLT